MDELLDTVVKLKFKVFFCGDVSWSYWAVLIYKDDIYKAAMITPYS